MINEIHDERYRLRIVSTDVKSVGYDENGDIHVSFGLFEAGWLEQFLALIFPSHL